MAETFEIISIADLMARPPGPTRNDIKALKAYAASNLERPPWYHDRGKHHGDRLLKGIVWKGRQWAVTDYGLECREYYYPIEKSRLWEDEEKWGWVRQIGIKTWSDLLDFAEALRIARGHHGQK